MDLRRHDAFCPCASTHQGQRPILVYYLKKIGIGIGPPYRFLMSPSAVLLLQNFSPTTTDRHYPVVAGEKF